MTLVSVVIPTRNRPGLLGRAIASLDAQVDRMFEATVVNDGGDPAEVERAVGRRPYVSVIHRPTSGGPGAARNTAIQTARGELLLFLDDDDEWKADNIAVHRRFFESRKDVDFTWCDAVEVRDDGTRRLLSWDLPGAGNQYHRALRAFRPGTALFAVRTEAFRSVGGFDENLRAVVDTDLALRMLRAGLAAEHLAQTLVVIHRTSGPSVSKAWESRAEALDAIFAKHQGQLACDPASEAVWLRRIARLQKRGGATIRAIESLQRVVLSRRFPARQRIAAGGDLLRCVASWRMRERRRSRE